MGRPVRKCGTAAARSRRSSTAATWQQGQARCTSRRRTACFTHSASRSNTNMTRFLLTVAILVFSGVAHAQFPDGPGKAEMTKVCSGCHELERAASMHQDRDAWRTTFDKMIALGAKGTDA